MGGNLYDVKPEVGRYDANYGLILLGNKKKKFKKVPNSKSGILFKGQVRDIINIRNKLNSNLLFVLNNNDTLQSYVYN